MLDDLDIHERFSTPSIDDGGPEIPSRFVQADFEIPFPDREFERRRAILAQLRSDLADRYGPGELHHNTYETLLGASCTYVATPPDLNGEGSA